MSLTRRRLLTGSAGLLAAGFTVRWRPAFARAPMASAVTAPQSFLRLSETLTGMAQPNAMLAQRLYSWLYQQFSGRLESLDSQLSHLSSLLAARPDAQGADFLAALDQQPEPLRDLCQALISGWYLGVVDSQHPRCIAFENIVSYQLVRGSLLPPSYAPAEPNFWTQPPHRENPQHD